MINALPVIVSDKLTLLPGEFSTRTSRLGSLSPTLMKARAEEWKLLVGREALSASRRKIVVDAIFWCSKLRWFDDGYSPDIASERWEIG